MGAAKADELIHQRLRGNGKRAEGVLSHGAAALYCRGSPELGPALFGQAQRHLGIAHDPLAGPFLHDRDVDEVAARRIQLRQSSGRR